MEKIVAYRWVMKWEKIVTHRSNWKIQIKSTFAIYMKRIW